MGLNPVETADVIKHLGYPAIAVNRDAAASPAQVRNYIINTTLYQLQTRLKELDVVAEAQLTGKCIGTCALVGPDPAAGNTVSVTITSTALGSPVTLTATASTGTTKLNLGSQLIGQAAQNAALVAAGFVPGGAFQGSPVLNPDYAPDFELKAPSPFTMTVSSTGLTNLVVTLQGQYTYPQMVPSTGQNPIYGYIQIINYLESAIANVTQNADVAKAGTYVRGRELRERRELESIWKKKLSKFLGVPLFSELDLSGY